MATTASPFSPSGPANGDTVPPQPGATLGVIRAPSRRRRAPQANDAMVDYPQGLTYLPAAPEVPRGLPAAYGTDPASARRNGPMRSFSARTRDLQRYRRLVPLEDGRESDALPRSDPLPPARPGPPKRSATQPLPVKGPPEPIPSESSKSQAEPARRASDAVSQFESEGPGSPLSRSNTVRSAKGERHDWALNRSPLQRLEVTLHGISKEEKRARVQEAEMRLREQIARRRSQREKHDNAPISVTTSNEGEDLSPSPPGDEPSALNMDTTTEQRDAPPRSATVESKRSEPRQVPEGRREVDRREYQYAAKQTATSLADATSDSTGIQYAAVQAAKQPQYASAENSTDPALPGRDSRRAGTGYHSRRYSVGNTLNHAPTPLQREDSSSRPTLGEPFAPEPVAPVGMERTGSKRLQRPWRPDYGPTYPNAYDGGQPSSAEEQTSKEIASRSEGANRQPSDEEISPENSPGQNNIPIGLGLNHRFGSSSDNPLENNQLETAAGPKPKRHTVSFDMPPPTPPPEWKQAPIVRLQLSDMDFQHFDVGKGKAWWERTGTNNRRQSRALPGDYEKPPPKVNTNKNFQPPLFLKCGPLLRYTGLKRTQANGPNGSVEQEIWRGSVLIVTKDSQSSYGTPPTLRLFYQPMDLLPPPPEKISGEAGVQLAPEYVDPAAGLIKIGRDGRPLYVKPVEHVDEATDLSRVPNEEGLFEQSPSPVDSSSGSSGQPIPSSRIHSNDGEKAGQYREIRGIRLHADPARDVTFWRFSIEVELGDKQERIAYRINEGPAVGFWVPARGQPMNIMFHSCNGFSLSVDSNKFSGPDPLWRDVLNEHQTRPFHVMIGGGDQIYNDGVMVKSKLFREWTELKNAHHKHRVPFDSDLKADLEIFYLENYAAWFSQGLFSVANCQIPMINIWDDHDIIDGFGSYSDHLMGSPVFSGLGNVAFKYYMLYQHQSVPEETEADEPSWILGADLGPYIRQRSRSVFMSLGKNVAFLGLDCRTERMRHEVLSETTYDLAWDRCHREIVKGETKHLIVLLGIPIAYPRLVWLENLLTSRVMDPVKALGRAGLFGGLLNKFDGSIEILDDLDDHWTAKKRKLERNWLIEDLQDLAAEKSVRITILSGDVHLAAIGQFYSNPKLNLAKDKDFRYMPNVISSAIVNSPPPDMVSDILNKRNKTHHVDAHTDEDMIPIFTEDVDGKPRNNKRLLPRRNWCSIREYHPGSTPPPTPPDPTPPATPEYVGSSLRRTLSLTRGDSRSGSLLRKLSRRGPPPTRDFNLNGATSRRASVDVPHARPDTSDGYFPPQEDPRPSPFHRRPTNLSQKSAKKAAIEDDEGVGAYMNLEGGLNITIHSEVNSSDPSGITIPYRLLVPALWHEGGPGPQLSRPIKGWKKWLGKSATKDADPDEGPGDTGDEEGYEGFPGSDEVLPHERETYGPGPGEPSVEEAPLPKRKLLGIISK